MKKLLTIAAILISNTLFAQLPYTWVAGVNPGWVNTGVLNWQGGCAVVTTNCAGNYTNNLNTFYTSPSLNTLCASTGTVDITFQASGNAEFGFDFLFLEYSLDNGVTWINPYGVGVGWTGNFGVPPGTVIPPITVPTSATFKFRFNFFSDGTVRSTGYKIWDFDIACTSVLPIELTDFHCETKSDNITIYWTTATETNNQEFQLWRSTDAINWVKIVTKPGAGTSISAHSYWFLDYFPPTNTYYYRLIQKDYNGVETSSDITSCSYVESNATGVTITYYNMLDQVVNIDNSVKGFYIKEYSNGSNVKREVYYKQ